MLKSKFINRHSEFEILEKYNKRALFNDLSSKSTFLGSPGSGTDFVGRGLSVTPLCC